MKYWLAILWLVAFHPLGYGQATEVKPMAAYGIDGQGQLAQSERQVLLVRYVIKPISTGFLIRDEVIPPPQGGVWIEESGAEPQTLEFKSGIGFLADTIRPDSLIGQYSQLLANGKRKLMGAYFHGKRHGTWRTYFHDQATTQDSGMYDMGIKTGSWNTYFPTGRLKSTINYVAGKPSGPIKHYWPNGRLHKDFVVAGNEITTGQIFDSLGNQIPLLTRQIEQEPNPINMQFIKSLISYPEEARNAGYQGIVTMRILIDTAGNYIKHYVIKSPHHALTEAVESQIRKLKFKPAFFWGTPVKIWVTIPFSFSLREYPFPLRQEIISRGTLPGNRGRN